MPANIVCPCGHTVKIPDEQVKTRIRCPVCGELLSTNSALPENESAGTSVLPLGRPSRTPATSAPAPKSADEKSSEPKATTMDSDLPATRETSRPASSFHAKGGFLFAGLPTPSFCAKSSVSLLLEQVLIQTTGPFGSRLLDLRLSEVASVEIRRCPGWYLLFLVVLLLPANGVGLVFLIPFLLIRHSYLILKCGTATVAIRFKGDDTEACAIGDAILQAAQAVQTKRAHS